ncbi:phosphotransferase [Lonsdalea britannica]|uniref:phosphotransferase n=1 Tax=Lonsdalea britannica TaxID=1082704 RepID=UPI0026EDC7CA|nr:phosphotransferase [Lonsdalea britannica]
MSQSALLALLEQQKPASTAGFCLSEVRGLSAESWRAHTPEGDWLARQQTREGAQLGGDRRREFRVLRQLSATGLAPQPVGLCGQWLLVEWLDGSVATESQFADLLCNGGLAARLAALHHQPRYGFPLPLKALLARHWQNMAPARRTPTLLRHLKRWLSQPLPPEFILAPLHLDVHPGNLVQQAQNWRLIDWEYAADGDIALELAALFRANTISPERQQRFLAEYCRQWSGLSPQLLSERVQQWLPWVDFLMLMWYEVRWQQTRQTIFLQAATPLRLQLGLPW